MLKKIGADVKKRIFFFQCFFIDFPRKIDGKSCKKRGNQLCAQKSTKKHVRNAVFLAKNRFLANFWAPPGSPGPSRDDPENSQNRSFFSFMVNCARKRARAASGRPQEGPGGPPRRPRGGILCPFFVLVLYAKNNRKKKASIAKVLKRYAQCPLFCLSCSFFIFLVFTFSSCPTPCSFRSSVCDGLHCRTPAAVVLSLIRATEES